MGIEDSFIGDTSRPRKYCLECGEVVYCDDIWTKYPPGTAEKRLKRIHKKTGCKGEIKYMAGVSKECLKAFGIRGG